MENTSKQPVSNIVWIHREELCPNLYNPNVVAPAEMDLLRESILSEGWLFPILVFAKSIQIANITNNEALDKHTILDGFHRYTLSGEKAIYALTGGYVPAIVMNPKNPLAVTVRMNRAKGTHTVLKMSEIIEYEVKSGKPVEDIMQEFGMEFEEVRRLANSVGIPSGDIISKANWSQEWIPGKFNPNNL